MRQTNRILIDRFFCASQTGDLRNNAFNVRLLESSLEVDFYSVLLCPDVKVFIGREAIIT